VATWYLVVGGTGAGKSTAARELAERVGGVRFSIDEWMTALYWMDCPEKDDFPWAIERVGRCEAQIVVVAEQLAGVGISSVLDLGFTARAQRREWLERGRAVGVRCVLEVLEVDAETRWERVCERNRGVSGTFSFVVTRVMFELMEERFEGVGVEELEAFGGEIPRG